MGFDNGEHRMVRGRMSLDDCASCGHSRSEHTAPSLYVAKEGLELQHYSKVWVTKSSLNKEN